MKKAITLILFLSTFKLFAVAYCSDMRAKDTGSSADSSKKVAVNHPADSVKVLPLKSADTVKVISLSQIADSAKAIAAIHTADSVNGTAENPVAGNAKSTETSPVYDPKIAILGAMNNAAKTAAAAAKKSEEDDEPIVIDNNPPVTSLIQLDSLKAVAIEEQIRQAALQKLILRNEQLKIAALLKTNNLDSLKLELQTATIDTLKAVLNTHIALKYMNYDTIVNRDKQYYYQNQAIFYTLQAIKSYAQYNDTIGLRLCFDNLAKVYHEQKKFAQAKWFILQSNTLSRAKNDTPNIIASLLTLSAIKTDIKDYTLAMGDLDEALTLSKNTHTPRTELEILRNYGYLYSLMQNYPKEAQVLRRRELLADSIQKSDDALIAKMALQKKKQEMLQNKKKLLTANSRKISKNNSTVKIASL